MPDLNMIRLIGRLTTDAELRVFDSETVLVRLLVTVKVDKPQQRVDVIPVTAWDPSDDLKELRKGDRVVINGSIQRRFWESPDGGRSRLEVVAARVQRAELEAAV